MRSHERRDDEAMIKIDINSQVHFACVTDGDSLTIGTANGLLEFCGQHDQDCCEDVAFDFDEISKESIELLQGEIITSVQVNSNVEGGVLIRFFVNKTDPIFKEFISHAILVGCHNIQNGYYNNGLEMCLFWQGKMYSHPIDKFTKEIID